MDELFKNKLDGREMPFNEAHWEAAQQLLDNRDTRSGAIWWWRSGLVAILLAIGVFILVPYGKEELVITEEPIPGPSALPGRGAGKAMPEVKPSSAEPPLDVRRQASTGRRTELQSPPDATVPLSKTESVSHWNSAHILQNQREKDRKTGQDNPPEPSSPTPVEPSDLIGPPLVELEQKGQGPDRMLVENFDQAPRLAFMVDCGECEAEVNLPDPCWPVKNRWAVHTILGANLPAQGNQAGALLGLGVDWPGRNGFGIYAEGLYRIRQLSGLPTQMSLQRSYGFGVSESAFELQANTLHYADGNVGATYGFSRHQLHAGAGASLLIGARGQLEQAQKAEEMLDYGPASAVSEGWIRPEGLSRVVFRAQAGYGIQLYSNVQLAGRIQYRFTPVLKAAVPSQPQLTPLSFDLMLKYKLW